jgi:hypothetical protein
MSTKPFLLRLTAALTALLAAAATADPAPAQVYRHLGYANCSQSTCHGATAAWATSVVRQDEYFKWRDHDPHAQAYRSLTGEKARVIAAKLALGDSTQAPMCLGCHSDAVPVTQRGADFRVDEGIGCETCHGGSEKWLGQHNQPDVEPMSLTDRGLFPTWKPAERTQLCLSCHQFGQRGANHALVAAGHPVFTDDLPRYFAKWPRHFDVSQTYVLRKHPPTPAQLALRTDLQAAANWAAALAGSESTHQGMMPELSFFQCDNCHRSINRPDKGSTGLPRLDQVALRRLVAGEALTPALRQQLSQRADALDRAVLRGDRSDFYQAARALRDMLETAEPSGP